MKLRNHFPGLLSLNGIVLTSLSRNVFTDLKNASVDKPKRWFSRSMSQSANQFVCLFVFIFC